MLSTANLAVAGASDASGSLVTNLQLSLEIKEIKILDVSEFANTTGEFHFKRRFLGEEIRLPHSGEIERRKNQYIRPTDSGLAAEPFWTISWNELSNSGRIEFAGVENDPSPDTDDDLGTVSATFDFSNFEFIMLNTDRVLENKYYQVVFSIHCHPMITSPSHPDSTKSYELSNVTLTWTPALPSIGILGYSYLLDNDPETEPDDLLQGTHTSTTYTNLANAAYWFHIKEKDKAGFWSQTGHFKVTIDNPISIDFQQSPEEHFQLYPNYPNPFNMATAISYQLSQPDHVQIEIFDLSGRFVQQLVDEVQYPGYYEIAWQGQDESGNEVASGNYVYIVRVGKLVKSSMMTLLK